VLDRALPDERSELISGNAGTRHLAGAEKDTDTARAQAFRSVGFLVSVARFVGTIGWHADILCVLGKLRQLEI
jgi:hypothetical protein